MDEPLHPLLISLDASNAKKTFNLNDPENVKQRKGIESGSRKINAVCGGSSIVR